MYRMVKAILKYAGHTARAVLLLVACLSVAARSNATTNNNGSPSDNSEDPRIETLGQEGYRWNGEYEGITCESETSYDIDGDKIVGIYNERRDYNTEHPHTSLETLYYRCWNQVTAIFSMR